MTQYISKSALVAEIENLLDKGSYHEVFDCAYRDGNNGALYALKGKLNTLEVKELLTWQDIRLISEIGEDFMNSQESDTLNEEEYYTEILNRFKAQKGE